jgi:hypothetical protein
MPLWQARTVVKVRLVVLCIQLYTYIQNLQDFVLWQNKIWAFSRFSLSRPCNTLCQLVNSEVLRQFGEQQSHHLLYWAEPFYQESLSGNSVLCFHTFHTMTQNLSLSTVLHFSILNCLMWRIFVTPRVDVLPIDISGFPSSIQDNMKNQALKCRCLASRFVAAKFGVSGLRSCQNLCGFLLPCFCLNVKTQAF